MRNQHDLQDDAIERMEGRLRRELRRRNTSRERAWWLPRTPVRAAFALGAIVAVSMGVGGAVVAVAYQAQEHEQREQLAVVYEQRVQLAAQRVELVKAALEVAERRVEIGVGSRDDASEARARFAEAQAAFERSRVDVEEVRLSGREPRDEMSAPLVSGRDFVTRRLELALAALPARLDLERRHMENLRTRTEIGTRVDPVEIEVVRAKMAETETAVESLQRRMQVRQSFVKGAIDARRADLRALEIEAEMRHVALPPKIEAAQRQVERVRTRVDRGLSQQVDLAEATLRLFELQTELAKAQFDLTTIRHQLQREPER